MQLTALRGRVTKFALIGALVALVAAPGASSARSVSLAGDAAAAIAGQPVSLACVPVRTFNLDAGEAPGQLWAYGIAGGVFWADRHVELTAPTCAALAAVRAHPRGFPSIAEAVACFTLAHELGHLLGGPDEAAADRFGLAHTAAVAFWLGLRGRERFRELDDFARAYAPLHPGATS